MAGGFPVGLNFANAQSSGPVAASSHGIVVTANASANTVGSYTTLIAATAHDCAWLAVSIVANTAASEVVSAVNLAVGSVGNELIIVPNLTVPWLNESGNPCIAIFYMFPCAIPQGTRISASTQSTTGSSAVRVTIQTFDDAFGSFGCQGIVDTYGFNTGSTLGTSIDPGGSTNTKGAYSQITAATTADLAGLFFGLDTGTASPGSVFYDMSIDLAVGAGGSEKIILPDWIVTLESSSAPNRYVLPPSTPFLPLQIPAGSRIAARAQCSGANATGRLVNMTVYGVRL